MGWKNLIRAVMTCLKFRLQSLSMYQAIWRNLPYYPAQGILKLHYQLNLLHVQLAHEYIKLTSFAHFWLDLIFLWRSCILPKTSQQCLYIYFITQSCDQIIHPIFKLYVTVQWQEQEYLVNSLQGYVWSWCQLLWFSGNLKIVLSITSMFFCVIVSITRNPIIVYYI